MNEELLPGQAAADPVRQGRDNQTLGSSTIYRLCEEVISLRERNNRQHQEFERKLNAVRDDLKQQHGTLRRGYSNLVSIGGKGTRADPNTRGDVVSDLHARFHRYRVNRSSPQG